MGIVRPWGSFRVVLNAENGKLPVPQAFDGLVVEVEVGDLHVGRQGVGINGKSVILGGDGYPPRLEVFDRLVPAVVASWAKEIRSWSGSR